jgi:two-component system chemotaxis response regulator CheB
LIVTEADRPTGGLRIGLRDSRPDDRWVPGVDELFRSAVQALGARVLGIVLTGMGRDGCEGARLLAAAGAPLWTESPLTAAIDGMPMAAAQGHGQAVRLPLDELAVVLSRLLEQEAPT